jgi:hypothetical protein
MAVKAMRLGELSAASRVAAHVFSGQYGFSSSGEYYGSTQKHRS